MVHALAVKGNRTEERRLCEEGIISDGVDVCFAR